jgi:hypothetical protein
MDDRVDAGHAGRQLAAQIGNALLALHRATREREALVSEIAVYRDLCQQQGKQVGLLRERLNQFEVALISTIRELQRREGNFDCFATAARGACDQLSCLWRARCLGLSVGHQSAGC